ncbi:hypothetical protein K435DRAFT_964593 [Dendrothele bispora CBS 962.96]|uniref:Uncharacterized protein n=1 Tax=Dendrothele bispora (strain CBS 962.96) TaxID=1314807 RepID=A0A4S8MB01_DENBC|nr:hypothetical protein K435DRAFT_964593 [Dendrothele bispora CBS 962.96]
MSSTASITTGQTARSPRLSSRLVEITNPSSTNSAISRMRIRTTSNTSPTVSPPLSSMPQTMKTRIAILDKSPHRFQVVSLQQDKKRSQTHAHGCRTSESRPCSVPRLALRNTQDQVHMHPSLQMNFLDSSAAKTESKKDLDDNRHLSNIAVPKRLKSTKPDSTEDTENASPLASSSEQSPSPDIVKPHSYLQSPRSLVATFNVGNFTSNGLIPSAPLQFLQFPASKVRLAKVMIAPEDWSHSGSSPKEENRNVLGSRRKSAGCKSFSRAPSRKDINVSSGLTPQSYHSRAQSADSGKYRSYSGRQHITAGSVSNLPNTTTTTPGSVTLKTDEIFHCSLASDVTRNQPKFSSHSRPHIKSSSLRIAMSSSSSISPHTTSLASKRSLSTIPRLKSHHPATQSEVLLYGDHSTTPVASRYRSHTPRPSCPPAFQLPTSPPGSRTLALEDDLSSGRDFEQKDQGKAQSGSNRKSLRRTLSQSKRHAIYTRSLTLDSDDLELSFDCSSDATLTSSGPSDDKLGLSATSSSFKKICPAHLRRETLPISFSTSSSLPYMKSDSADSIVKVHEGADSTKQPSKSSPVSDSLVSDSRTDDLRTTVPSFSYRQVHSNAGGSDGNQKDRIQPESGSSSSISLYSQDSFSSSSSIKRLRLKNSSDVERVGKVRRDKDNNKQESAIVADRPALPLIPHHPIVLELLKLLDASAQEWMSMELKVHIMAKC